LSKGTRSGSLFLSLPKIHTQRC